MNNTRWTPSLVEEWLAEAADVLCRRAVPANVPAMQFIHKKHAGCAVLRRSARKCQGCVSGANHIDCALCCWSLFGAADMMDEFLFGGLHM